MRLVALLAAFLVAAGPAAPHAGRHEPEEPASARSLVKLEAPPASFRAVRRLEAANRRFAARGWMDVVTELSPESGFTYAIAGEGGSRLIRTRVLRPILEGERRLLQEGAAERSALTTANYAVVGEALEAPGIVRLLIRPLRRELTLVDGHLHVAADDADLLEISGRLARTPSFWTTRVDVVRRYARVAGVRVPVAVTSVARVRIAGTSVMTMTYRYEMVNGQPVTATEADRPAREADDARAGTED